MAGLESLEFVVEQASLGKDPECDAEEIIGRMRKRVEGEG